MIASLFANASLINGSLTVANSKTSINEVVTITYEY